MIIKELVSELLFMCGREADQKRNDRKSRKNGNETAEGTAKQTQKIEEEIEMADIQTLLGDDFKEGMTLEEINAALEKRDLVDKSQYADFVPKTLLDKANAEAASYKKKWRESATAQEQKAIDDAERQAQIEDELKTLRRASKVSEYEKQHLSLKYDEKDAREIAEALYDGDMDTVFNIQKKHEEAMQKAIKAQLMKEMPAPPAGNQAKVDYSKQIADAQASGNMALMASLIRQEAAANANK